VRVRVRVFDITGQEIRTLVDEKQVAGEYVVRFDGNDLPAGIYFVQLSIGGNIETIKLLLINDL